MEIRINTAESGPDEYTALIALLASLGGRLPTVNNVVNVTVDTAPARAHLAALDEAGDALEKLNDESGNFPSADDAVRTVDSKGTPWDARIHSESKATVADGTWRKRRGVSDELFHQVMMELHADDDKQDEAPPPPPADDTVPLAPSDDSVPVPPAPTEETPSEPEPAASAPAVGDPQTNGGQFADFASFVAAVAKMPDANYVKLNEMAGVLGVAGFKEMKDHADKWDMFFSMIG